MKKLMMVLLFASVTMVSFSQEFMGVKVNGKKDLAINTFKSKGFILKNVSNSVAMMIGKIGTDKIELLIHYTPITKVVYSYSVFLPEKSSWYSLKSDYEKYMNILTEKYGSPEKTYSFFHPPYNEGDGYEMTAVEAGDCGYIAFWTKERSVLIAISTSKQVLIVYKNAKNSELYDVEMKSINSKMF